jgi:hypothetical protein
MTEDSVHISITIKVEEAVHEFEKEVSITRLEESVQAITLELSQQVLKGAVEVIDAQIAANVPAGWRNVGTEERWMVSSLGAIRYKRRVYLDEQRKRRKPVDELLGLERYERMSIRVKEMGSSMASMGTYRMAAGQLSWMIKTPVSHSAVQRMAWGIGNRIADGEEAERRRIFDSGGQVEAGKIKAEVLYGESDGVWVHLQREKRKSTEVRVAILSTGRKQVGKDRYRLENKRCLTAIGLNSEMWQEQIVREAHLAYDLRQTKILICGGDGNQWVRHSFDRMELPQQFVLDRFHLLRAARRAYQDRAEARRIVIRLRQEGFDAVKPEMQQHIQHAEVGKQKLLIEFYLYVHNHRDGLLDLKFRDCSHPACLGAIEGNVDKLVVHRIKGRGCSWRLPGLRAMLALCRNKELLLFHAYHYIPLTLPNKSRHQIQFIKVDHADAVCKSMPVFSGPHQNKPWVKSLSWHVRGR